MFLVFKQSFSSPGMIFILNYQQRLMVNDQFHSGNNKQLLWNALFHACLH